MYTIEFFDTFTGLKKIDDLDLHEFVLFFEKEIANRKYSYSTTHRKVKKINIEIFGSQLPHLLGIHKSDNLPTKRPETLYKMLLDGEITIDYLKSSDSHNLDLYKDRILLLPFFYQLFHQYRCGIKLVGQTNGDMYHRRKINMVFEKDHSSSVYLLELREKQKGSFTYVPTSITVYRKGDSRLKTKCLPLQIVELSITKLN